MKKIILCDFDGTITKNDTLVEILDKFAHRDWRHIEKSVRKQRLPSRIALKKEFALCNPEKTTKEQIVRFLNEEIDIDPYFIRFLKFSKKNGYDFMIISGGFSICIDTILKKYGLEGLPYYSNKLLFPDIGRNGRFFEFTVEYPYLSENCGQCGNCKTAHLKKYRLKGYYIIYIGDSTTDRCPARYADLLFAKNELIEYCVKQKLKHMPFKTFADIKRYLETERSYE